MAYTYLLKMYETIDLRIKETKKQADKEDQTPETLRFLEGRLDILYGFRLFLSQSLNNKLPKRIRKKLSLSNKED